MEVSYQSYLTGSLCIIGIVLFMGSSIALGRHIASSLEAKKSVSRAFVAVNVPICLGGLGLIMLFGSVTFSVTTQLLFIVGAITTLFGVYRFSVELSRSSKPDDKFPWAGVARVVPLIIIGFTAAAVASPIG